MKELDLFSAYARLLLEGDAQDLHLLPVEASDGNRLHQVASQLLAVGTELRQMVPRPRAFVNRAAVATLELARLVAPAGTGPQAALVELAALQEARLEDQASRFRGNRHWRKQPPEEHLYRAFWNLAGVGSELPRSPYGGLLEEHAADAANYLLFVVFASGAFSSAVTQDDPDGGTTPLPAEVPPHLSETSQEGGVS